jgi:hypothetical protein
MPGIDLLGMAFKAEPETIDMMGKQNVFYVR